MPSAKAIGIVLFAVLQHLQLGTNQQTLQFAILSPLCYSPWVLKLAAWAAEWALLG